MIPAVAVGFWQNKLIELIAVGLCLDVSELKGPR
jgi:hypothetical protein